MNKYITVLTIFFIATITCTHAFYLPGVAPKEFKVDDRSGIKNPEGLSGHRLEAKVHLVTSAINTEKDITPNGLASISSAAYTAQKIYIGKSFENASNKNSESFQEAMSLLDQIQDIKRQSNLDKS